MAFHSFHLAEVPASVGARALARPLAAPGLRHAEPLALMRLGAPVLSPSRLQVRRLAVFAEWDDENALDAFLTATALGDHLARGWHVRLEFVRRWGHVAAYEGLPERTGRIERDEPVVAVTLARMRVREVPRFLRWGTPVEQQVRDHPGSTLAGAAMRPTRTIATFSVWSSVREMTGMVHGAPGDSRRHVEAMGERERRDFHREFATYRFRPLSEHGSWQGRSDYVPKVDA